MQLVVRTDWLIFNTLDVWRASLEIQEEFLWHENKPIAFTQRIAVTAARILRHEILILSLCMCGPEGSTVIWLKSHLPFLREGLSMFGNFLSRLGCLVGQEVPGICSFLSPQYWGYEHMPPCLDSFTCVLRIERRFAHLQGKCYQLGHLPSLTLIAFFPQTSQSCNPTQFVLEETLYEK